MICLDAVFQNNGMHCLEGRLQVLLAQINVQGVLAHTCMSVSQNFTLERPDPRVVQLEGLRDFKELGV